MLLTAVVPLVVTDSGSHSSIAELQSSKPWQGFLHWDFEDALEK
jgi:hypothetical protein